MSQSLIQNQCTTQSQHLVLSQNEDTTEASITLVNLNANLQFDLEGTIDVMISQSVVKNNKLLNRVAEIRYQFPIKLQEQFTDCVKCKI